MSAPLATRWIAVTPALVTAWFGADGRIETMLANRFEPGAIPTVIGPRGDRGPGGNDPVRIDAPLASTWILANPLGRIPIVHVFLAGGERVLADVTADAAHITVTFPSPRQGFVLAL